jgi:hypothetical protein
VGKRSVSLWIAALLIPSLLYVPVLVGLPAAAQGEAEIAILTPTAGSIVSSLGFRLEVDVRNFTLDSNGVGGPNYPGRGHSHVYVDDAVVVATADTTLSIGPLPLGDRTIRVDLRNNDHSALDPPVEVEITVRVVEPRVAILEPGEGATVGPAPVVRVLVEGFVLDPEAPESPPEPGRGHLHVFVDGALVPTDTGSVVPLEGLSEGEHVLKVRLYDVGHTPLTPEVSDEVTVRVAASASPPGLDSLAVASLVGLGVVLVVAAVAVRRRRRE